MINVQPYIDTLELLKEYMAYWISEKNISLSHTLYTKDYDYPGVNDYFINVFTKAGWIVTEDRLIYKKKSFEEWSNTMKAYGGEKCLNLSK